AAPAASPRPLASLHPWQTTRRPSPCPSGPPLLVVASQPADEGAPPFGSGILTNSWAHIGLHPWPQLRESSTPLAPAGTHDGHNSGDSRPGRYCFLVVSSGSLVGHTSKSQGRRDGEDPFPETAHYSTLGSHVQAQRHQPCGSQRARRSRSSEHPGAGSDLL